MIQKKSGKIVNTEYYFYIMLQFPLILFCTSANNFYFWCEIFQVLQELLKRYLKQIFL